jgi:hypothetical protein
MLHMYVNLRQALLGERKREDDEPNGHRGSHSNGDQVGAHVTGHFPLYV